MKRLLYILVFIALVSCKKSSNTAPPAASLSFKADGTAHSYTGDWNPASLTGCSVDGLYMTSIGYFVVTGVATQSSDGFEAHVHAPAIEAKTYNTVEFEAYLAGVHYTVSSDCVVTISKIENGRASGTFSGKVAQNNFSSRINITEGIFANVPVR